MQSSTCPPEDEYDDDAVAPHAGEAGAREAGDGDRDTAPVEFLSDLTQIYLHEIGFKRLLGPADELHYARLSAQGDFQARQTMIEHNLRLVVNIAKAYLNRGIPLLDLVEEGNLGLMHALEKFDPERGFRFSTYATWWIRQNIERAIMNQSRTIRLPVHIIKEINLTLRARRHLEAAGHGEPRIEDIAHLLGKPVEAVRRLLSYNEHTASLDAPLDVERAQSISEVIADETSATPEVRLHTHEVEALVRDWLAQLNDKQRNIIERRFGFNGQEVATLESLAGQLGVTRERVRQIQLEALAQLRRLLQRRGYSRDALL